MCLIKENNFFFSQEGLISHETTVKSIYFGHSLLDFLVVGDKLIYFKGLDSIESEADWFAFYSHNDRSGVDFNIKNLFESVFSCFFFAGGREE